MGTATPVPQSLPATDLNAAVPVTQVPLKPLQPLPGSQFNAPVNPGTGTLHQIAGLAGQAQQLAPLLPPTGGNSLFNAASINPFNTLGSGGIGQTLGAVSSGAQMASKL